MKNTKDILFGRWQERKAQAYQQWGKFINNDLSPLDGKTGEVDVLFRQYHDLSSVKVNTWMNNTPGNHEQ